MNNLIDQPWVQSLFCVMYTIIFVLGIFGNILVCIVVFRNKAMQTVTNLFITNLAISDIMMCIFAVPFTPLYTFIGRWTFGSVLCHLMPFAQGCSVYISTLTLTSIAIDRFFVIIYPFRPRMKIATCLSIVITIWIFAILVTLPYALFMTWSESEETCDEAWPNESLRQIYGAITSFLQFVLPFVIIACCYTSVSFKLNDRAKSKPKSNNCKREEIDQGRKRRTNQMLIAMVTIFGISWLPLNAINISNDFNIDATRWEYYFLFFFTAHILAMSSTCYNPFIYAWLNENFRKEFKVLLPFFDTSVRQTMAVQMNELTMFRSEKTYNGNTDTYQESLATSSGVFRAPSVRLCHEGYPPRNAIADREISSDVKYCHISTHYNLRKDSVKLRLIDEESLEPSRLADEDTDDLDS